MLFRILNSYTRKWNLIDNLFQFLKYCNFLNYGQIKKWYEDNL